MNAIISQLPDTVQPDWPDSPQTPQIFPNEPMFNVPPNPLLPPGYQEILSYSNLQYLNGFLRTQIGNFCQVTVMIGTNNTTERSGILIAVGINYLLLMSEDSSEIETVDFYNIKFVRFRAR